MRVIAHVLTLKDPTTNLPLVWGLPLLQSKQFQIARSNGK
jgi:hypothetical protein